MMLRIMTFLDLRDYNIDILKILNLSCDFKTFTPRDMIIDMYQDKDIDYEVLDIRLWFVYL